MLTLLAPHVAGTAPHLISYEFPSETGSNCQKNLRGAPPRTPLGLPPQTPARPRPRFVAFRKTCLHTYWTPPTRANAGSSQVLDSSRRSRRFLSRFSFFTSRTERFFSYRQRALASRNRRWRCAMPMAKAMRMPGTSSTQQEVFRWRERCPRGAPVVRGHVRARGTRGVFPCRHL